MPWIKKDSTPEEVAAELKMNLEDSHEEEGRLLILGTKTPNGYVMRMSLKSPETVAGILYNHAIKTGELNEALKIAEHLVRIGVVAQQLIHKEVLKRKQQN